MKRTEYSFGKIDFNGSRAVIPTKQKGAVAKMVAAPFSFSPNFIQFWRE